MIKSYYLQEADHTHKQHAYLQEDDLAGISAPHLIGTHEDHTAKKDNGDVAEPGDIDTSGA
jgi:hypothetical protein